MNSSMKRVVDSNRNRDTRAEQSFIQSSSVTNYRKLALLRLVGPIVASINVSAEP